MLMMMMMTRQENNNKLLCCSKSKEYIYTYIGKFDPFGQRRVVKVRKSFAGAKREENRRGHTFSLLCVCGALFSPDNLDELFPMYDSRFVLHIIKYLYIYRRTEFVGAV